MHDSYYKMPEITLMIHTILLVIPPLLLVLEAGCTSAVDMTMTMTMMSGKSASQR